MRVLFLTHRVPYPPDRGDRLRAMHIVRLLSAAVDLEVVSLAHDAEEASRADTLSALFHVKASAFRTSPVRNHLRGALKLPGQTPLTHCLLDAPGLSSFLRVIAAERRPDVVLAYCSGMARFAMEPPLRGIPFVLDFVDVDSAKWAALAETTAWPRSWIYHREAACLRRFEAAAARAAATCTVVNERERQSLLALAPEADVHVVGLGVDIERLCPPSSPAESEDVVFCGVMNYEPNVDGVLWFAREVWPRVRQAKPAARFVVVGSNPVREVRALSSEKNGIVVTGTVPDVREHLWRSAIAVAPLRTARGLQNKVLEALAAGLPTILTPTVFDGLPASVHQGCRIGASAEEFSDHVIALLQLTPDERRSIASLTDLRSMTWDAQIMPLIDIIKGLPNCPGIAIRG